MAKRYQFSEREIEELVSLKKHNKDKNVDKRIRALLLYANGTACSLISLKTEFSSSYIFELVAKYRDKGLTAISGNNYHGNHRNMSYEEEEKFLEQFRQQADAGQLIEVSAIKKAYEEKLGRSLEKDHGIIYNLLKRHGLRKIMPRSTHPNKASDEEIQSSKKLKKKSWNWIELSTMNQISVEK